MTSRLPTKEEKLRYLREPGSPTAVDAWHFDGEILDRMFIKSELTLWAQPRYPCDKAAEEARRALKEREFREWYAGLASLKKMPMKSSMLAYSETIGLEIGEYGGEVKNGIARVYKITHGPSDFSQDDTWVECIFEARRRTKLSAARTAFEHIGEGEL